MPIRSTGSPADHGPDGDVRDAAAGGAAQAQRTGSFRRGSAPSARGLARRNRDLCTMPGD